MMMMPDGQQQQQPATITVMGLVPTEPPPVITGHPRWQSVGLGVSVITAATLSVIFNIVTLITTLEQESLRLDYLDPVAIACHGIWGGLLVCTNTKQYIANLYVYLGFLFAPFYHFLTTVCMLH